MGGGAINVRSAGLTLTNCVVTGNSSGVGGGALLNDTGNVVIHSKDHPWAAIRGQFGTACNL